MFKSNTFKISYSCTSNLGSKIIPHNNKILNKIIINDKSNTKDKLRNCRREPCPLNNQCLVSNIIFRATVTSNKSTKQYMGSTENHLNKRYMNQKYSLKNTNKRHTTELASYLWNLKDNNTDYKIKWEVLNGTKSKFYIKFGCRLCKLEKNHISNKNVTINK